MRYSDNSAYLNDGLVGDAIVPLSKLLKLKGSHLLTLSVSQNALITGEITLETKYLSGQALYEQGIENELLSDLEG